MRSPCPASSPCSPPTTLGVAPHHGFVTVHPDFARPPLATDVVRFVGEAIAVVVADSIVAAADGAAAIWADYEPLDIVVDPEAAFDDGAPVIFPDHGSNQALVATDPPVDLEAVSDVIVRGRYVNQRVAVVPMETERLRRRARRGRAADVLRLDPDAARPARSAPPRPRHRQDGPAGHLPAGRRRASAARPGSAPSTRPSPPPPATSAARCRGRRRAATTSCRCPHSRGQIQYAELGARRDGTFTGLRVHLVGDAGAYPGIGAFLPAGTKRMANGTYRFPAIQFDVAVAVTNTTPMGAYRGAGRPEATALLERLVDHAAHELDIDPIELRRRNLHRRRRRSRSPR